MKTNFLTLAKLKSSFSRLIFMLAFVFAVQAVYGQVAGDYRSRISGQNWSVLNTWERFNGSTWVIPTAGQGYPGQNAGTGTVTIQDNHTVTLNVSPTTIGTLIIGSSNSNNSSALNFNAGNSLSTSANVLLRAPTGNNQNRTLNIGAGSLTIGGNLNIGDGGYGSQNNTRRAIVTLSTGTLSISGNLILAPFNDSNNSSRQAQLNVTGAGRINLGGSFSSTQNQRGTLDMAAGSTFNYNGSSAQTILFPANNNTNNFPIVYSNLHINNTSAAGASLSSQIVATRITGNISVGNINPGSLFNTNNFAVNLGTRTITVSQNSTLNKGTSTITSGTINLESGNITATTGAITGTTYDVQSGNISAILAGSGGLTKTTTGTVTLSGANTYTGLTTVSAGTLQLGASGVIANASPLVLAGGTLRTGAAAGFSEAIGTLGLTANSTIALGTGSHNLNFAASNAVPWTPGQSLTITGWTRTNQLTGTSGRIFVGNTATGLTAAQLAQINFQGFPAGANILSTGEVVPDFGYRWEFVSADLGDPTWCAGETRNITVTIKNVGSLPWSDASPDINIGVRWNPQGGNWNDFNVRTNAGNVAPGETRTYTLPLTASNKSTSYTSTVYGNPLTVGTNNIRFDVVNENNFWFRDRGSVEYVSPDITITGLTVNPGPTQTICQGGTTTGLGGSIVGSATLVTWSDDGIGGTFSPNANTLNATWTPPPTYGGEATLILTASGGACAPAIVTRTKIIRIIGAGGVTPDQTVCSGGFPSKMDLITATGNVQWQRADNPLFNNPVNVGTNNLALLPAQAGAVTATTYFRAIVSEGSCSSISPTITVTVPDDNSATSSSPNQTSCVNTLLTPIIFNTTGASNIGPPVGLPPGVTAIFINNTITITGTPTAEGTYNYSIPLTGGCGTAFATGTITVNLSSIISDISTTVCSGDSFTAIPVNGVNGVVQPSTSYSWSAPSVTGGMTGGAAGTGTLATGITGTLVNTTNIPRTATYTVTPTVGGCVGATFKVIVTVSPKPSIPAQNTSVCSGTAFSVTPINGAPNIATVVPSGTTYKWTVTDNPNVTGDVNQPTAQASISQTLTNTTHVPQTVTYSVTPISGAGGSCEGNPFTLTVVVEPTPVIPAQTVSACSGSAFTVSPVNGIPSVSTIIPAGTTYTWSVIDNPNVSGEAAQGIPQSSISQTLINNTSTVQTVVYNVIPSSSNSLNCAGSQFTVTVLVNPRPAITPISQTVCSEDAFTVTPENGTNGVVPIGTTYTWSAPNVTGGITGGAAGSGSAIIGTLTNTTSTPQTATYTVTPTSGTCTGSSFTVSITVNPKPALTPISQTVCSGDSFAITPINGTNGVVLSGTTYAWSAPNLAPGVTGGATGSGNSITGTLTNTTNTAQTATYTVTPTTGTCIGSSFIVTITVSPKPALSPISQTVCTGNSFTITPANVTNGVVPTGTTYAWTAPTVTGGITGGVAGSGSSITGTLINPTNTAQTATYTVTPTAGACAGNPFTVTVNVNPSASITTISEVVCNAEPFTITPTNGANGVVPAGTSYSWSTPNVTGGITGGAPGSGNSITGTLTNSTNTSQTATYTVTPTTGTCIGSSFTVTVSVGPKPALTSITETICSGDSFTITPANGTNGVVPAGTTFAWSVPSVTGGVTGGVAGSGNTITGTLTNPTNTVQTATYTVTPTSGSCIGNPFTLTFTVNPRPSVTNITETVCNGGSFTVTPVNGTNGIVPAGTTYSWSAPTVTGGITGGAAGSGSIITGTLTNPTSTPQTATYTVTPTSGSCVGSSFTVTATINPFTEITSQPNVTDFEVCFGDGFAPISITATGSALTYQWYKNTINSNTGGILIPGATSASFAVPSVPEGVSYYYVIVSNGCNDVVSEVSGAYTVFPSETEFTTNLGSNSQTICPGDSFTEISAVAIGANLTYQWYSNSTQSNSGGTLIPGEETGSFTPQNTISGPTYYYVVAKSDCGTVASNVSGAFEITGATSVSPDQTVCVDSPLSPVITHLTTGTSGIGTVSGLPPGVTASWSANVITISGTPSTAVGSPFNYSIQLIGGCNTQVATGTITVNPIPTVTNMSLTQTICAGESTTAVTLTSDVDGATFAWTATGSEGVSGFTANGTGSIPLQTITTSGTEPGTVTYVITPSFNGCTGPTANYTVTVNPVPTVTNTSLAQTICAGESTTAVTITSDVDGATFAWTATGSAGVSGFTANGTGSIPAQTITTSGTETGTVTYAITPSFNGCTGPTVNYTVTVNPVPTVTNASLTQTICAGESTTAVTLTSDVDGATFAWTATGSAGVSGFTANGTGSIPLQTITTSGTGPGTVTYVITPSFNGCTGPTVNYTVTVNPVPTVTNASLTQTICAGESTTAVTITSDVAGASFAWTATGSAGVSGFTANGTGSIPAQTITTSGTESGTVTYAITPSFNGCTGPTVNYTVTVNPVPIVTNTSLAQTICAGESTTAVTITSDVAGASFAWTATGSAGVSGFTANGTGSIPAQTITTSGTETGTVTYAITPSFNGCTGPTVNYTVTVNPVPTVTNTSLAQTICAGESTTAVTITSDVAGATFAWTATGSAGVSGFTANGTGSIPVQTITTSGTVPGTVTYVITPSFNGCTGATSTYTVTVNLSPEISTPSPITSSICSGETFSITPINGTNGLVPTGTTYTWTRVDNPNVSGDSDQATAQPNISQTLINSTTSVQTVIYTVTPSAGGCIGTPFEVRVSVSPIATVNDPTNQTICGGSATTSIDFSGNAIPGVVYNWTNTATSIGLAASGTGNIPSFIATNSGSNPVTAEITVTPVANGCSGSPQTFTITVNPSPTITISPDYCVVGGKVQIIATSPVAGVTWSWNTNPVQTSASILVEEAGSYTVTGISPFGCISSATISIGEELIVNGSFTDGNTGFISDYTYIADNPLTNNELVVDTLRRGYGVGTNGQNYHPDFWGVDHTQNLVGPRNMMIVNGKGGTLRIWEQTVVVEPNRQYNFSAWAMSINDKGPFARLRFQVNGQQVGTIADLPPGFSNLSNNGWVRFSGTWNSGDTSGRVVIRIVNLEPALFGNDFALDDISFSSLPNFIRLETELPSISQTVCNNSPLDPIIYTLGTGGQSPAVSGLPPGITSSWNGVTLTFSGIPTASGTFNYNISTLGNCIPLTAAGSITVLASPTEGVISEDQTICSGGDPLAFTNILGGTGDGVISYVWESNTNLTTPNWTTIPGETAAVYDVPAGLTTTTQYRRITLATSGTIVCESIPTELVQVTVQEGATAGSIVGEQTICSGGDPAILISTTNGTGAGAISYIWESSVSPFNVWSTITDASDASYNPPAGLTATTQYRRITVSTLNGVACPSAPTSPVTVIVQAEPLAGSIGEGQTICTGGDPVAFTSITPGTGDGTITYRWESAVGSFTDWSSISEANSATYDAPAGLTVTTQYRRVTISTVNSVACESISDPIEVTVLANNTVTSATPQEVCVNDAISLITLTTTGATGIANNGVAGANGLPNGVSASWIANVITISGTPTESGVFNYNIPLLGGCGAINATGTITATNPSYPISNISVVNPTSETPPYTSTFTVSSPAFTPGSYTIVYSTAGINQGPNQTITATATAGVLTFSSLPYTTEGTTTLRIISIQKDADLCPYFPPINSVPYGVNCSEEFLRENGEDLFLVPAGVSQVSIEVYGNGTGGNTASQTMNVVPGGSLFTVFSGTDVFVTEIPPSQPMSTRLAQAIVRTTGPNGRIVINYDCSPLPPCSGSIDALQYIDAEGYTVIRFTGPCSFTAPDGLDEFEVLVVGGGGGGGYGEAAGGGGGGAVVYQQFQGITMNGQPGLQGAVFNISLGAGGLGSPSVSQTGGNGENSSFTSPPFNYSGNNTFSSFIAEGGGGGGSSGTDPSVRQGASGASGGGGAVLGTTASSGGSGTNGFGSNGGNGNSQPFGASGAGGGGASDAGGNGTDSNGQTMIAGNGGSGRLLDISGEPIFYGAGGGGTSTGSAVNVPGLGGSQYNSSNGNPIYAGGNGNNNGIGQLATTYGSGGGAGRTGGANGFQGAVFIRYSSYRILPIEFLFFNAKYNSLLRSGDLTWATAKEWENDRFEIERSVNDVKSWEIIGQVTGAGFSDKPVEYSLQDLKLPLAGGNIFYRLKQVDFSGEISYSDTKAIKVEPLAGTTYWRVFPNPTTGDPINLEMIDTGVYDGESITVRVISATGVFEVIKGESARELSGQLSTILSGKAAGIYTLEISWGIFKEYHKVILKR